MVTLCDIEKNDKFWRHFHGEVRAWGMLGFPQHFYLIFIIDIMYTGHKYYGRKGFYAMCVGGRTEPGGAIHIYLL